MSSQTHDFVGIQIWKGSQVSFLYETGWVRRQERNLCPCFSRRRQYSLMGVKQPSFLSLWTWLVLNFSVPKEESNCAWPSKANIFIIQMPEQPSSTTRVETTLPIAQWMVHLCIHFLLDVSTGTRCGQISFSHFFSMSQLLSKKASNSQKEELCHQMHTSPFWMEPNLPLNPVQQLQKQRGALACGESRGCTF